MHILSRIIGIPYLMVRDRFYHYHLYTCAMNHTSEYPSPLRARARSPSYTKLQILLLISFWAWLTKHEHKKVAGEFRRHRYVGETKRLSSGGVIHHPRDTEIEGVPARSGVRLQGLAGNIAKSIL